MEQLKSYIREVPDFPKPGITFYDITTLFQDRWGFKLCLDIIQEKFKYTAIDKVVGIESRGFILGAALADRLNCGFVVVRKKGKLPAETVSESYELEYGTDTLEIHTDAIKEGERVLLIDDLLATGGTLEASAKLIEKVKGKVIGVGCIIELPELGGRGKLTSYDVHTLVSYAGA